jgi:predicted transcriptional regulator
MEIRWLAILLHFPLAPERRKKRRLQQFPLRQSYVPERKKWLLGNAFPPRRPGYAQARRQRAKEAMAKT